MYVRVSPMPQIHVPLGAQGAAFRCSCSASSVRSGRSAYINCYGNDYSNSPHDVYYKYIFQEVAEGQTIYDIYFVCIYNVAWKD